MRRLAVVPRAYWGVVAKGCMRRVPPCVRTRPYQTLPDGGVPSVRAMDTVFYSHPGYPGGPPGNLQGTSRGVPPGAPRRQLWRALRGTPGGPRAARSTPRPQAVKISPHQESLPLVVVAAAQDGAGWLRIVPELSNELPESTQHSRASGSTHRPTAQGDPPEGPPGPPRPNSKPQNSSYVF